MAKIAVEGIKMHAYHGVYNEERKKGTLFVVDVYIEADVGKAGGSDDLSHTIDYQSVYQLVIDIMQQPVQLLEKLTQEIGQQIMKQHSLVDQVTVRVSKIRPLMMKECDRTYVEMSFESKKNS